MERKLSCIPFAGATLLLAMNIHALAQADVTPSIQLDSKTAAPASLAFGQNQVPLIASQGGFTLRDFNTKTDVAPSGGQIKKDGAKTAYTAGGDDLELQAVFAPEDGGIIHVTGEIRNKRSDDRAIIVRYLLPLNSEAAVYEDDPDHSVKAGTQSLGTVYPLAATTGTGWGVSIAVPPTSPCCFGMVDTGQGTGVEFYLGLSAKPKAFPNRAAFEFIIYPAEPGWGFRSALAQYYKHYPAFYKPRFAGSGFWNWNDKSDGIDAALPLYKIHGITHAQPYGSDADFAKQLDRDKKYSVLSFDYTIVGQRELTKLPDVPSDYDGSITAFHQFEKQWRDEAAATGDAPLHKRYLANWRNNDLPDLIGRCVCTDAEGHFRIDARSTAWGGNSITFVMNPNPDLFSDKGWENVGSMTLKKAAEWFTSEPADGIMVDSLGNHWPAVLNYRQDHFIYARYPLTFDTQGRVALHNNISHYEFLQPLRELANKDGKLIFGNAIIRYQSPDCQSAEGNENYNGAETGRWFSGALLDAAGREIEQMMDRKSLEFFRSSMGPKLYTAVLYQWTDPAQVRDQMNRALVYDVFAAPNRWFGNKISYLASREGYERDKDFLAWFSKNARMLHEAGWQPVTWARTGNPDVVCERYGSGNVVYFALVNLGKQTVPCELVIDLKGLKMSPDTGEMSNITEVAKNEPVKYRTEGNASTVSLNLEPNQTRILKLSRAW